MTAYSELRNVRVGVTSVGPEGKQVSTMDASMPDRLSVKLESPDEPDATVLDLVVADSRVSYYNSGLKPAYRAYAWHRDPEDEIQGSVAAFMNLPLGFNSYVLAGLTSVPVHEKMWFIDKHAYELRRWKKLQDEPDFVVLETSRAEKQLTLWVSKPSHLVRRVVETAQGRKVRVTDVTYELDPVVTDDTFTSGDGANAPSGSGRVK